LRINKDEDEANRQRHKHIRMHVGPAITLNEAKMANKLGTFVSSLIIRTGFMWRVFNEPYMYRNEIDCWCCSFSLVSAIRRIFSLYIYRHFHFEYYFYEQL
jgi:hypothetical protein